MKHNFVKKPKGTLYTPVIDRFFCLNSWRCSILSISKKLRSQLKIVVGDARGGSWIRRNIEFLKSCGFHSISLNILDQKGIEVENDWFFYSKKVSENLENCKHLFEGDFVIIYEDDIEFGRNYIETLLINLTNTPNAGVIGAPSLQKKKETDGFLVWQYDRDQMTGLRKVGSIAMGLLVTYRKYLCLFPSNVCDTLFNASVDISYCKFLKNQYGLGTFCNWDLPLVHRTSSFSKGCLKKVDDVDLSLPVLFNTKLEKESRKSRKPTSPVFLVGSSNDRYILNIVQCMICSSREIFIEMNFCTLLPQLIDLLVSYFYSEKIKRKRFKNNIAISSVPFEVIMTSLISSIYKKICEKSGFKRWGVSIIDGTDNLLSLLSILFPEASFIFIHSDSKNRSNESQIEFCSMSPPANCSFFNINFEELRSNANKVILELEDFLLLRKNSIDRNLVKNYL